MQILQTKGVDFFEHCSIDTRYNRRNQLGTNRFFPMGSSCCYFRRTERRRFKNYLRFGGPCRSLVINIFRKAKKKRKRLTLIDIKKQGGYPPCFFVALTLHLFNFSSVNFSGVTVHNIAFVHYSYLVSHSKVMIFTDINFNFVSGA